MAELLALADDETRALWDGLRLGYTESTGHPLLRREIAGLYERIEPDEVLVFAGAEEAIFCLVNVLLGPGDHAIVTWPGYQSLYEVARAARCGRDPPRAARGRRLGARRRAAPGCAPPEHEARRRQRAAQPDRDAPQPRRVASAHRAVRRGRRPSPRRRGLPVPRVRPGRPADRQAPTLSTGVSRSASSPSRSRWPASGSAGWRPATGPSSPGSRRSRTTPRSARRRRPRSWGSSRSGRARRSSPGPTRSSGRTCRCSTGSSPSGPGPSPGCVRGPARSASRG